MFVWGSVFTVYTDHRDRFRPIFRGNPTDPGLGYLRRRLSCVGYQVSGGGRAADCLQTELGWKAIALIVLDVLHAKQ